MHILILKSLQANNEQIELSRSSTREHAEQMRKTWRKLLGNKNWTIDRRPGLDSLDHLVLKIVQE